MSRTGPATPLPERVVALERGTEPFSGLPMIWAGGLLPDVPFDPTARAELLFDGTLKTWPPAPPDPFPGGSQFRRPRREAYAAHADNNDAAPRLLAAYAAEAAAFAYRPTISVLMPVYDVEVRWLSAAVESVRAQVYDHW